MYIYLLGRKDCASIDTYDEAVVYAETEEEARRMHPNGCEQGNIPPGDEDTWVPVELVTVELIGVATAPVKAGVILSSFIAG